MSMVPVRGKGGHALGIETRRSKPNYPIATHSFETLRIHCCFGSVAAASLLKEMLESLSNGDVA